MAKYDKAGLAMIPSGYKASKVYSLIPNSTDGDFDFARSSSATRVNKDGLIETVATNVPRLDYPLIDGVVQETPSLLLEPSRENIVTHSEDFTNASWAKTRVTISGNQAISPDGSLNADKIISDATTNSHFIRDDFASTIGVVSVFAKADEFTFLKLSTNAFSFEASYFDLVNGVYNQGANHIAKMEDYGNGWFRCSIYVSQAFTQFYIENAGNSASATHTGDGTSGIYIWGAMVEAGSYATSYIPTSGNIVTRSAETCNGAGTSADFNDSEGVFFIENSTLQSSGEDIYISISDGTASNRITIRNTAALNNVVGQSVVGGVNQASMDYTLSDRLNFNKVCIKYKLNDFALWANGFEVVTDTSGSTPTGLNVLGFDNGAGAADWYGRTKQLITFKQALTDAELEDLTSWDTFNEMATQQLYTIE